MYTHNVSYNALDDVSRSSIKLPAESILSSASSGRLPSIRLHHLLEAHLDRLVPSPLISTPTDTVIMPSSQVRSPSPSVFSGTRSYFSKFSQRTAHSVSSSSSSADREQAVNALTKKMAMLQDELEEKDEIIRSLEGNQEVARNLADELQCKEEENESLARQVQEAKELRLLVPESGSDDYKVRVMVEELRQAKFALAAQAATHGEQSRRMTRDLDGMTAERDQWKDYANEQAEKVQA